MIPPVLVIRRRVPQRALVRWAIIQCIDRGKNSPSSSADGERVDVAARRTGQSSQISDVAVFLASDRASYFSGTIVTVDYGQSLRAR